MNDSAEGKRMTVETISSSVSWKVSDRARIKLVTPGSAVRLASVARHITDCATRPGALTSAAYIQVHSIDFSWKQTLWTLPDQTALKEVV